MEPLDMEMQQFYDQLLAILSIPALRDGNWRLIECLPAWDGNWTSDCFVAFAWQSADGQRLVVVANFAPNQSQCWLRLPFPELAGKTHQLCDQLSTARYDRDGTELGSRGLYLDLPPWGYHAFQLRAL